MKKIINKIKFLAVVNPVIVIVFIYMVDLNYVGIKALIAGSVTILCSLEFYLLDKLYKLYENTEHK
ncbi:hypothetical protein E4100_08930 [Soehngenia longivitae]|jgi:hypothetical protein|uniref:Uncharacterized protein n=1 Tax=Soehngenia longivitae TaxID=2562294 RepID=A0A4Z0D0D4_9FIRM|nr:hypothetical protein [Soehngenia longivitae]TFZ39180.1 hypothetical protein E4100_08930 [Soehngenia longivitae]HOK63010.1 hypothetical protein [Soehngenia sp.]